MLHRPAHGQYCLTNNFVLTLHADKAKAPVSILVDPSEKMPTGANSEDEVAARVVIVPPKNGQFLPRV